MSTANSSSDPPAFIHTHPFDKVDGADTILRSSDGADFHVHRLILSLASPVFETMFSLPQADAAAVSPVIDLPERAAVLDAMLRLIYPGACPNIETTDLLQEVTEALIKYDMQGTLLVAKLHLEKFHASRPLAVYALAVRCGWKDVALRAARESLKHPIREPSDDAAQQIKGLSAVAYHNLLQYHFQCAQAVDSTTSSLKWFNYPTVFESCVCSKGATVVEFRVRLGSGVPSRRVPKWFYRILKDIPESLNSNPVSDLWDVSAISQAFKETKCDGCRQFDLVDFVNRRLRKQLDIEFDKVELKF